jgi:hypothetical protein
MLAGHGGEHTAQAAELAETDPLAIEQSVEDLESLITHGSRSSQFQCFLHGVQGILAPGVRVDLIGELLASGYAADKEKILPS